MAKFVVESVGEGVVTLRVPGMNYRNTFVLAGGQQLEPGQRADAPVGADRAVDEPRAPRANRVRTEAELLGEAGAEALEQHVRPVGQPQERVAPVGVAER